MEQETINMDTASIDEIVSSINSKMSSGSGGFSKSATLNTFSCMTSIGIGANLINSICNGIESINTCINQISNDLHQISAAQEKVDDEIIEASIPFNEDFKNDSKFSPVTPDFQNTEATNTDKVTSTYADEIKDIEEPTVEKQELTDIKTPVSQHEEIKEVTEKDLISELENHYIKQIKTSQFEELIEFDYDTRNILKQAINNINISSSYSELLNHEISLFYEYLKEICSKLNISSTDKLITNEELLNILIKSYDTNPVSIKLSEFSTDIIKKELSKIE